MCKSKKKENTVKCPHCGKPDCKKEWTYCRNCGNKLKAFRAD